MAMLQGAIAGLLGSMGFVLWIGFGGMMVGSSPDILPITADGCSANITGLDSMSLNDTFYANVQPAYSTISR